MFCLIKNEQIIACIPFKHTTNAIYHSISCHLIKFVSRMDGWDKMSQFYKIGGPKLQLSLNKL
jgi:hypothetical protein